jgi:hypothetical protein
MMLIRWRAGLIWWVSGSISRPRRWGPKETLRGLIEQLRSGQLEYDQMRPLIADCFRTYLKPLRSNLNKIGAVQPIAFRGVSDDGSDVYDIGFTAGSQKWSIFLGLEGKIARVQFYDN